MITIYQLMISGCSAIFESKLRLIQRKYIYNILLKKKLMNL